MPRNPYAAALLGALLAAGISTCAAPPAVQQQQQACTTPTVRALPIETITVSHLPHAELSEVAGEPVAGAVVTRARAELSADRCTLVVGWTEPLVLIASELRDDTCAWAHVLRHELEHVRIYLAALEVLPQRIRTLMDAGAEPLAAADAALLAVRALHADHDNPRELRANHTACSGRIVALLARSL